MYISNLAECTNLSSPHQFVHHTLPHRHTIHPTVHKTYPHYNLIALPHTMHSKPTRIPYCCSIYCTVEYSCSCTQRPLCIHIIQANNPDYFLWEGYDQNLDTTHTAKNCKHTQKTPLGVKKSQTPLAQIHIPVNDRYEGYVPRTTHIIKSSPKSCAITTQSDHHTYKTSLRGILLITVQYNNLDTF